MGRRIPYKVLLISKAGESLKFGSEMFYSGTIFFGINILFSGSAPQAIEALGYASYIEILAAQPVVLIMNLTMPIGRLYGALQQQLAEHQDAEAHSTRREIVRLVQHAALIATGNSILLLLPLYLATEPFLTAIHVNADTAALTGSYLRVALGGAIGYQFWNVFNTFAAPTGNMNSVWAVTLLATLGLVPGILLTLGHNWGVQGPAIASTGNYLFGFLLSLGAFSLARYCVNKFKDFEFFNFSYPEHQHIFSWRILKVNLKEGGKLVAYTVTEFAGAFGMVLIVVADGNPVNNAVVSIALSYLTLQRHFVWGIGIAATGIQIQQLRGQVDAVLASGNELVPAQVNQHLVGNIKRIILLNFSLCQVANIPLGTIMFVRPQLLLSLLSILIGGFAPEINLAAEPALRALGVFIFVEGIRNPLVGGLRGLGEECWMIFSSVVGIGVLNLVLQALSTHAFRFDPWVTVASLSIGSLLSSAMAAARVRSALHKLAPPTQVINNDQDLLEDLDDDDVDLVAPRRSRTCGTELLAKFLGFFSCSCNSRRDQYHEISTNQVHRAPQHN